MQCGNFRRYTAKFLLSLLLSELRRLSRRADPSARIIAFTLQNAVVPAAGTFATRTKRHAIAKICRPAIRVLPPLPHQPGLVALPVALFFGFALVVEFLAAR